MSEIKKDIIDVKEWKTRIKKFSEERDWDKFHTPKNIASALNVEASELLEIFQWLTADESFHLVNNKKMKVRIGEELSDVLIYAIRLAGLLEIPLEKSLDRKFKLNKKKYPKNKVRGSAKKYNEY